MKTSTGSNVLDKFLGGYEKGIVTGIYGPGGSGKTLFLLMAMCASEKNKKIVFIDTESNFSTDRIKQICPNHKEILERTIFLKPTNFEEQEDTMKELASLLTTEISMILVDSLTSLYRVEMGPGNNYELNKRLAKQLRDLVTISRKKDIPVLVTAQVYNSLEEPGKMNVVSGAIVKNMSKCLLEIIKDGNKRTLVIRRHRSRKEGEEKEFKIVEKGIE